LELTRKIAAQVSIPVIAAGGAGTMQHIVDVITQGCADAVSLASMLHYNFVRHREYRDDDFVEEGNVEFLKGRTNATMLSAIEDANLQQIKAHLTEIGIDCRYEMGRTCDTTS
ncbi:MAG TPA: HisA/HisF-related TIM barrel protein, partial [Aggregatilineales bacterium]|nr:HisA/HisF-related TIM barrel protein [Aggregatilineales bacterium]